MRAAIFVLAIAAVAGSATAPTTRARAAPVSIPWAGGQADSIHPVWYDRWGRWHPPYYRYGYRPLPGYYAYGPPRPYGYWRWRRAQCFRYGYC